MYTLKIFTSVHSAFVTNTSKRERCSTKIAPDPETGGSKDYDSMISTCYEQNVRTPMKSDYE